MQTDHIIHNGNEWRASIVGEAVGEGKDVFFGERMRLELCERVEMHPVGPSTRGRYDDLDEDEEIL
jgi:hypothetical protein